MLGPRKGRAERGRQSGVFNRTGQCNFSGKRDRSAFIVLGQRDNWTAKIQDGTWTIRDKEEKDVLNQENDVLKQENDVQKQGIWSSF